jgi:hypothetical protein
MPGQIRKAPKLAPFYPMLKNTRNKFCKPCAILGFFDYLSKFIDFFDKLSYQADDYLNLSQILWKEFSTFGKNIYTSSPIM